MMPLRYHQHCPSHRGAHESKPWLRECCLPHRMQSRSYCAFSAAHPSPVFKTHFGDRVPVGYCTTQERPFYTSKCWAYLSTNLQMYDSQLSGMGVPPPLPAGASIPPKSPSKGRDSQRTREQMKSCLTPGKSPGLGRPLAHGWGLPSIMEFFSRPLRSDPRGACCEALAGTRSKATLHVLKWTALQAFQRGASPGSEGSELGKDSPFSVIYLCNIKFLHRNTY